MKTLKGMSFFLALSLVSFASSYFLKIGNFYSMSFFITFVFFIFFTIFSLVFVFEVRNFRLSFMYEDLFPYFIFVVSWFWLLLTDVNKDSIFFLVQLTVYSVVPYFLIRAAMNNVFDKVFFFKMLSYASLLVLVIGIFHSLFVVGIEELLIRARLGGELINPVGLASIFFILIVFMTLGMVDTSFIKFTILFLSIILLLTLLYLTGSRASMLAALTFFLILLITSSKRMFLVGMLITVLVSFILFLLDVSALNERYSNPLESGSVLERVELYAIAIDMVSVKPFVGWGTYAYQNYTEGSYPHNLMLELFVSFGVLGLSFFILLVLLVLFRICTQKNIYLRIFLSSIFSVLLIKMFSFNLAQLKDVFILLSLYASSSRAFNN
ncbi:O-antigen ligase family protein [Thiomicrorhabdus xiamenensis]|uniref:O-antigen ligase family protein n=1 Tax=Thiomicrorhabdus xiamenensis TaxID=2739063 RepID=A0A7D4P5B2_9GAMM|nr:O-antigen ligase family protein [Thiomicrorhabdus xiamenensis]QKI89776.1 O-antigen ligase family protein [Thiomicrorhabdus xiamenensis]